METKKIKTPSGIELELKPFITGRELRALKDVFLDAFEISAEGESVQTKGVKGSLITKMEDRAIEMIILSVAGKTEGILDEVLNLPAEDYDFVMAEVNKIGKGLPAQKKTN